MPEFKLLEHKEFDEEYQGINLTEFFYLNSENSSDQELIDYFIHSKHFTEESLRDIVKNDTQNRPFLRRVFEPSKININNFRGLDKQNLIKFLTDYSEQNDWDETDVNDFKKLKETFIELIEKIQSVKFYLISKQWFNENDKCLLEPENWIYSYYFLIIWLDKSNKTLTITEWTYD